MAKQRKVLIIEDKKRVREDLQRMFRMDDEFEFEVTGVETVEEAETVLKNEERRFDLVVIDWRLEPLKDGGLKILEDLKSYLPKIKIVYTAYATIEACVKAIKAGADDYIDKNQPGSMEKLLNSAKEKLRQRSDEEHEPDSEWLATHLDNLREKYYGEIIAFIDGKVVGHAKTKKELIEKIKINYPDEKPFIMFAPVEVI
ncbi:MAG: response regulator [Deltaproteobacteria bacterium]|nr:response regulator [Deltaproteobacteria bacterium]